MKRFTALFSVLFFGFLTATVSAETFYLTKTQPAGTYWGTTGYWSENGNPAAHSGADYLVDSGYTLRSPENGSAATANVFTGDSLTLGGDRTGSLTAGTFTLKGSATVDNMTVVSGNIFQGVGGKTFELAGNINILGSLKFVANDSPTGRKINITAKVAGAETATMSITTSSDGFIQFSNANNTYAGSISVSGNSVLKFANAGAVGSNPTITLAQGAKLVLDTPGNLSLKSLTISYPSGRNNTNNTLEYLTATLPNVTTTVSTNAMQAALKAAGVEVPLETTLSVTGSTREVRTYYLNTSSLPTERYGWNQAGFWTYDDGGTKVVSTVVPTLGDTVHLTNVLRTTYQDNNGKTLYFLPTTYLDAGGVIGLKSVAGMDFFPDLILNGGSVSNYGVDNKTVHIGGHMTATDGVTSTFTANNAKRSLDVDSDISGSGSLTVTGGGTVRLGGNNTEYTGTMTVKNNTILEPTSANALTSANVVTEKGSKIKVTGNQKMGTWTTKYSDGRTTDGTYLMPKSITVSDKYVQDALLVAGMDAPIGAVITSDSTREGKTYYATDGGSSSNWTTTNTWHEGSTSGTNPNGYIPTVGDVAYITNTSSSATVYTVRTPENLNDVEGATHYFLAELHIGPKGNLGLKNANATVCVPNLILEGGSIGNAKGGTSRAAKLDGSIRVVADSTIAPPTESNIRRTIDILADISGSANLTFRNTGIIALSGDNSGFTGKAILDTNTTLRLNSENALGPAGDLTTQNGAELTVNNSETLSKLTAAGTLKFNGTGILEVPSIDGSGITLNQTGATLYLTGEDATIDGTYNQTGGALRRNFDSPITITGDLALSNLEINADDADLFNPDSIYPILYGPSVSSVDWSGLTLTGVGALADISLSGMLQDGIFYIGSTGAIGNYVPEPATWALLLMGLFGLALRRKK